MANLTNDFLGITSPNPFWLASAPPTDKEYNVTRAFKAGWGGVVWKTLGFDPHIVNVNGPRYGVVHGADRQVLGLNNIELITDRPLDVNLREIKRVKRDWPDRAMIVSLMVPCDEASWKAILPMVEDTGADGIELNFGCPHGMSERGMGAAVGQVPEYVEMVTRWCKQNTRMPVIVKLTPNISDIRQSARAAHKGGADAVSLINTVNSITSVDLDLMAPEPTIDGKGTHGGYCGPAVKPIALNTAMTYGFGIIKELTAGLSLWMDEKGYSTIDEVTGRAVLNVTDWQHLNLNYVTKARIDQDACIKCGRCYAACEDTSHQAISMTEDRVFEVIDAECVACNLCVNVCPVENCITMERLAAGAVDPRTGLTVTDDNANWTTHPNNPMAQAAE